MKEATAARGEAGRGRGQAPRGRPDADCTGLGGHRGPPGAWVPGPVLTHAHAHWDPTGPPRSLTCRVGLQGFGDREGGPRWGDAVLGCSPAREGG